MAETLVWVQENNINDLTELNDQCKTAQANAQAAYERLSQAEDELYKTNEQIHYAGQYLSTKEVQQQFPDVGILLSREHMPFSSPRFLWSVLLSVFSKISTMEAFHRFLPGNISRILHRHLIPWNALHGIFS